MLILGCLVIITVLISVTMDFYFNRGDPSKTEITTVIYAEDPAPENFLTDNFTEESKTTGESADQPAPQPQTVKEEEIEAPKADGPMEQKEAETEKTQEAKEEPLATQLKQETNPAEQQTTPSVQETKPTAAEVKSQFAEIEVYIAGGEDGGLNYNLDAQASQEFLDRLPFGQMVLADKKEELSDIDMTSGNFVRITSIHMNTLAFYQSKEQALCTVDDQPYYYDPPQGIYDTALALARAVRARALPDGTRS